MYGKYSLFYKSHKNLGYYMHAQTVSTRPLFGGEWPGDEASKFPDRHNCRWRQMRNSPLQRFHSFKE